MAEKRSLEDLYAVLSDALEGEPVATLRQALEAVERLKEDYQQACGVVVAARGNMQELIDKDLVVATVKFNGGNPVVLCAVCGSIIGYSAPQKAKAGICAEGEGCGALTFDPVASLLKKAKERVDG